MDGCTMGGPLSVTFSDIYILKMENDVVTPSKPIFYRRFVDDIYSRRKLGDNVLFDRLNSYHPNIKPLIFAEILIFVEMPYCKLNEIKAKHFLKKFHKFTSNSFRMRITWKTRNIRSLFPLKDKND